MSERLEQDDPGAADPNAEAQAQYRAGAYNRRVAAEAENDLRSGACRDPYTEFLCTCGRDDCDEILVIRIDEYGSVRASPHRFVVAPGHDTAVDDVVRREDEYWVVEVKPEFRLPRRGPRLDEVS